MLGPSLVRLRGPSRAEVTIQLAMPSSYPHTYPSLVLPSNVSFSSYPHTHPEGFGAPVPGGTVQRSHTHASKLRLIAPPTSTFDQPLQCTAALFGALRLLLTAWRSTNLYAPPVAEKVPLESLRAATSSMYEAPRE